jgi:ssDNA-binding Zn-finger/Zn-ribbon topoisomerase 1
VEIITKFCSHIIDVDFTRKLEKQMEAIEKNRLNRGSVLLETINNLTLPIKQLKKYEKEIGSQLNSILRKMRLKELTLTTPCQKCGSTLKITTSRKTKKRFIGCTGYQNNGCDFSLPLPQEGKLALLKRSCKQCNFQLFRIKLPSRKAFTACPNCYLTRTKQRS